VEQTGSTPHLQQLLCPTISCRIWLRPAIRKRLPNSGRLKSVKHSVSWTRDRESIGRKHCNTASLTSEVTQISFSKSGHTVKLRFFEFGMEFTNRSARRQTGFLVIQRFQAEQLVKWIRSLTLEQLCTRFVHNWISYFGFCYKISDYYLYLEME